MSQASPSPLRSRFFLQIMLTNALAQMAVQMLNTTIVPHAVDMGYAASLAGILSGAAFVCALILRPFSGLCTNGLDKRRLLMFALLLLLLSSLGLTLFSAYPLMLLTRALQGAGYAFVTTLCMAIVADLLPADHLGQGMGYFGLSQCIAQMAGPGAGLWLTSHLNYHAAYAVVSLLVLSALLCGRFLPALPPAKTFVFQRSMLLPGNLIAKESLLPSTVGLLFSILNSCLGAFLALYATTLGLSGAGIFFLISATVMFFARLFGAGTADRRSLRFTGLISGTLLITSMLLLGLGRSTATMWLAAAFFGVGYGFLLPVTQSRSVSAPPPEKHGTGSSTYFLGIDLGFCIGTITGGFIVQHGGPALLYLCLILPALLAMTLCALKGNDR